MSYKKLDPQPACRDLALSYDELGDGLYPGEVALALDTGHLIAVSVEQKRIATGEGVGLNACARWIDAGGRTRLDAHDQHVEASFTHTASAVEIDRYGIEAIQREMVGVLLGEPPSMVPAHVDLEAPPPANLPEGTVLDPAAAEVPMYDWPESLRLNGSIAHVIEVAGLSSVGDVSAILKL